ncbi:MAG: 3'-5' exonuclease [Polaromonas sp.]|jgi:DNA polymerase-3 subunit epsilon
MLHRDLLKPPARAKASAVATPDWPQHFQALAATARDMRLKAYYAAGVPSADAPLSSVPMAALDIETTGLEPGRHEIVSIALVPMNLAQIQSSGTRHWVVKPQGDLTAESVTFHGITHSQVAQAPDLDTVLQSLLTAMAGRVLVVHCREIERGFLDAALTARLGEGLQFPVIDTMELEARLHRRPAGFWARWRQAPPPSIRLADSRRRYGLPGYRPHHAPTDALASAELLLAQVADRFSPQTPLGALWW